MNKLTTVKTITKAAPLALLAIVISGSASAGPPVGDPGSPKGEKLTIDVENHCVPNGRFLDVTTTVTPSDSKKGDGGAEIKTPTADAMFKSKLCEANKGGKQKCSVDFVPVGADHQGMHYAGAWIWTKSIDLCATKDDETISRETPVDASISVPIDYDDHSTTTWVSRCDDIDQYQDYAWVMVGDQLVWMDVVDQAEVELEEDVVCPAVE